MKLLLEPKLKIQYEVIKAEDYKKLKEEEAKVLAEASNKQEVK